MLWVLNISIQRATRGERQIFIRNSAETTIRSVERLGEDSERSGKMELKIREHHFGAYRDNDGAGDWQIIHWAGGDEIWEELKKRSKLDVLSFFPVPVMGFKPDPTICGILSCTNHARAADLYKDCEGFYVAAPFVAINDNNRVHLTIYQVELVKDLADAVSCAVAANGSNASGAWVRLIFVYREGNRIKTLAEDALLRESDFNILSE